MSFITHKCLIWLIQYVNCVHQLISVYFLLTQGKTHKLKPGVKEPVGGVAKGAPALPLVDLSLRIYLCEGLLGRTLNLF